MDKNSIQFFNIQLLLHKNLSSSLTQIFGINKFSAILICKKFGFNLNSTVRAVRPGALNAMRKFILTQFLTQDQLKKNIQTTISDLSAIKTIRGFRHKLKLPVRGQRTRTNHRTQKRV